MTTTEQAREVVRWCRQLAECSDSPGATTRGFLGKPMREVHTRLAAWMGRLGMSVRVDAAGNLRGVYPSSVQGTGAGDGEPRLFIGSHLDTVPDAGAFDGVLGVVMGIALVESLGERRLPFSIEIVGFSEEEGVRFGQPFIGSRALSGAFDDSLLERRDEAGRSLRDAIRDFGLDPERIPAAQAPEGAIGYVEFHIEQGPVLESLNLPLAVVDAIAGQTRVDVGFAGMAGHAGTTPMTLRKDALACAAEWISEVERLGLSTSGLVATVGRIDVEPGAANVVPGRCTLSLDVRHPDDGVRKAACDRLSHSAQEIADRRGVVVSWAPQLEQGSVQMDAAMISRLDRAVSSTSSAVHHMTSGAGHDAMIVAGRMPAGMVFLRCEHGISHHPSENVREDDVAAALDAGMRFLDEMAHANG